MAPAGYKDEHFRLPNEQAEELRERAYKARMSKAEYIRMTLALDKKEDKKK